MGSPALREERRSRRHRGRLVFYADVALKEATAVLGDLPSGIDDIVGDSVCDIIPLITRCHCLGDDVGHVCLWFSVHTHVT